MTSRTLRLVLSFGAMVLLMVTFTTPTAAQDAPMCTDSLAFLEGPTDDPTVSLDAAVTCNITCSDGSTYTTTSNNLLACACDCAAVCGGTCTATNQDGDSRECTFTEQACNG